MWHLQHEGWRPWLCTADLLEPHSISPISSNDHTSNSLASFWRALSPPFLAAADASLLCSSSSSSLSGYGYGCLFHRGFRRQGFLYAESDDGLNWTKPNLGLQTWKGDKNNNLIELALTGRGYGGMTTGVYLDETTTNASQRYKISTGSNGAGGIAVCWRWLDFGPGIRRADPALHYAPSHGLYDPGCPLVLLPGPAPPC